MADVYDARPAYPAALLEAIATLATEAGPRVCDLGAGIGHLALPLAARGFQVTAVEPARAMLDRLGADARSRDLRVTALHAAAESVPVVPSSFDLVLIADALHFLDAEQTGVEVARILAPGGTLAIVTSELGGSPFMERLIELMEAAAPRRPRDTVQSTAQLVGLAHVVLDREHHFSESISIDHATLERILRSISFIGPAMNMERFTAFAARVRELTDPPIWARTFTLRSGRRAARVPSTTG
jgi:SAM-dependent methyltransferase